MNDERIKRIGRNLVAASWRDALSTICPPEVFSLLMRYDQATQGKVLRALQMQDRYTIRLLISQGGDPARSGQEEGWILAVNERIVTRNKFNPGGSDEIKSPHRWNFGGNNIELAKYRKTWSSLD